MKRIFLVGDSIRMGYDKYVRKTLDGKYEVVFPDENCRFAEYVVRYLHEWKNKFCKEGADVVHWNAGLWDVLHLFGDDCMTPPDAYAAFIEKICVRIERLFPESKVIFATSTPIQEAKYGKDFCRFNAEIEQYNGIAADIVKKHGFAVNDLYSVVRGCPETYYSDVTHLYTPLGTELTTNAVLRALSEALGEPLPAFVYTEKL